MGRLGSAAGLAAMAGTMAACVHVAPRVAPDTAKRQRVIVTIAPMTVVSLGQTDQSIRAAARASGWTPVSNFAEVGLGFPRAVNPQAWPLDASIAAHTMWRSWGLEAGVEGGARSVQRLYRLNVLSLVTFSATDAHAQLLLSRQRAAWRLGVGPTVLRTAWRTREDIKDTLIAKQVGASLERRNTSIVAGGLAQLGYSMHSDNDRVTRELTIAYRVTPAVRVNPMVLYPGTKIRQNALLLSLRFGHAF
jgi:hypothetical protein